VESAGFGKCCCQPSWHPSTAARSGQVLRVAEAQAGPGPMPPRATCGDQVSPAES